MIKCEPGSHCQLVWRSTVDNQWAQVDFYQCRWTSGRARGLSCSCHVEQWPCEEFTSCVGGSDRLVVSVSLSGLACIEQSATCLGFVCTLWTGVSLVWLALFCLGEVNPVAGWMPIAALITFSVSSCLSKPMQLWKHRREKGRVRAPDFLS